MSVDSSRHSIVFFGAGPVAAASLQFLAGIFDIEAVITKSRPTHHHGPVPVLEWCEQQGIKTYTPGNKAELSALYAAQPFHSPAGVVIDYGIIIAKDVIDTFPLGIINSHFSLLPEWRGADPITFAILSGQATTGISLMVIDEKMDQGPLLAQATYDIAANETTPSLTDGLIELSNLTIAQILPSYLAGDILPYDQTEDGPAGLTLSTCYSRKLTKDDGVVDWNEPATTIERQIRAYLGWPKSRCRLGDIEVVITKSHINESGSMAAPGDINIDGRSLQVRCRDGWLVIDNLKPAGKPEMTAEAFLAGYKSRLG